MIAQVENKIVELVEKIVNLSSDYKGAQITIEDNPEKMSLINKPGVMVYSDEIDYGRATLTMFQPQITTHIVTIYRNASSVDGEKIRRHYIYPLCLIIMKKLSDNNLGLNINGIKPLRAIEVAAPKETRAKFGDIIAFDITIEWSWLEKSGESSAEEDAENLAQIASALLLDNKNEIVTDKINLNSTEE